MLQVLNRDYKQTINEIDSEFPNNRYAIRMDSFEDNSGCVLVISTSKDSDKEFTDFVRKNSKSMNIIVGGVYSAGDSYSINYK